MKRGTIEHPKMKRLARTLGVHHLTAVGIMEAIWHWTAKYAPCGDIGKHSDEDIADGIGFSLDLSRLVPTAADFVRALVDCGWLDRDDAYRLIVHDWHQHADDAVKKAAERNKIALISRTKPRVATSPDTVATSPDKIRLPQPQPQPSHSHSPATATATNDPENVVVVDEVQLLKTLRADPFRLRSPASAVEPAISHGVTIQEICAIAEYWRKSGEHANGTLAPWNRTDLHQRILNALPGEDPEEHWPTPGNWKLRERTHA